ncbi:MAG: type 2 periplasmic-binding domain-containing protein [Gammaproteobacteria bacterium]
MKMKQVSIACTLALAGISGQAFALTPTQIDNARTAHTLLELFISGSSAQQASLGALAASVCDGTTIDVYGDTTAATGYRAYSCVAKAGLGTIAGNLLITDRGKGGSIYGVIPVARSEAIDKMVVSGASCTPAAVSKIDTAGRTGTKAIGTTYPLYTCSATMLDTPDMGVSDVEPDMFRVKLNIDPGTPWVNSPYTDADSAKIDPKPEIAAVFGIPVNDTIGGIGTKLNPAIPNLTKQQVATIMSKGGYTDWHQVDPNIPAGTTINVCRRVAGSGTQAGTNAWFMANPCLLPYGGALTPLTAADSPNVFENPGSGDVVKCMNDPAKGNAIGLLGIETQPGSSDTWHFATIDGQKASTPNAAQGIYDFFVESTFQYRKSTPAGAKKDLMDLIRAKAGDPAVISSLGIPGVLALPTNGWTQDSPYVSTNPVGWGSRGGHTCSQTQMGFPL